MLKRLFVGVLLAGSIQYQAEAQMSMVNYQEPEGWSLGFTLGFSDLFGDVGTKDVLTHYTNKHYWFNPKAYGGIYARYSIHPSLAVRASVNYGTLYASDRFNEQRAEKAENIEEDAYQRYIRNLDVKTNVWEGSLMVEFAPLRMNIESNSALRRFQPYIAAGVSGFHYKPKGRHISRDGRELGWIDLHSLRLEGQGFNFADAPQNDNLWQLAVPMGIGVRWDLGPQITLGVEYLYRMCFTDYLDNVSGRYINPDYFDASLPAREAGLAKDLYDKTWEVTSLDYQRTDWELRGNPDNMDSYGTFSVNLFWKIKNKKKPWW